MKRITLMVVMLFFIVNAAFSQNRTISGVVTSADDGKGVPGVTVVVKGTTIGTVTNINGEYTLSVPPLSPSFNYLVFSFIGMKTHEVKITGAVVNSQMENDAQAVDEVLVVAYGTSSREAVTGAVSQVDAQAIESRPVSSVAGALEGSTTGVQVNNSYGEPGKDPQIRIRGFSTINGSNDPLYVVDGVPYSGNISDINPNDVESMTVLKDAASAALYGNRAANGVIIITTKQGKSGKIKIDASMNLGAYTRGIDEFERLGPDQWMETAWTGYKNSLMSGKTAYTAEQAAAYASSNLINDIVLKNIYNAANDELFDANGKLKEGVSILPGYTDLDWREGVERTGKRQEYTVGISTAGDKYSIYSSLGYLNEEGYTIASDFNRLTSRLNTSFTPTEWLETGVNLNLTTTEQNYSTGATGSNFINPFYQTRMMAPIYSMYMHNSDGSYALDEDGKKQYDLTSPYLNNRHVVYELENNLEYKTRDIMKGQAYATISFLKDFQFTVRGDQSIRNENQTAFDNPKVGDGAGANGRFRRQYARWKEYTFQQQLFWKKSFSDMHHIDVLLGHENYDYQRDLNETMKDNMSVAGLMVNTNFTNMVSNDGYTDSYKTESYLARLRYNYDGKYYFDASFRRDGSSRFHPDSRWGNFYSFGANWNIEKEQFMKDIAWVDFAKLRASYGEVGNDAGVGFYGYQALYDIAQNGGEGAFYRKNIGNPDIKWETTATLDIALEAGVYDRVNFSVNYFDKVSRDLLFNVILPPSVGVITDSPQGATITKNIGSVSNRGFELALDVDVIKTKEWKWNIGTDATFLKNKVTSLPDGEPIISGTKRIEEGRSIYDFWTYQFVGVDQMNGEALYKIDTELYRGFGQEGTGTTEISQEFTRLINGEYYTTNTTYGLRDYSGTAIPDVYGSITSALKWKGLSLDMLFTYSLGGKLYDSGYRNLMSVSNVPNATHVDILNSWSETPAGITETSANRIDPNGTPVVDNNLSQYNNAMSNRWLLDASYFTVKNITLAYDLPKHLIAPLSLTRVRVKGSVENLAILTSKQGINPQFNFSGTSDYTYTAPRVFTFGVDISL